MANKKALLAKMKIGFVVCKLWKRNTQFFSALNMKWWIESHIALKVYTLSVIFLCWAIQNSRFIPYQQWTFIRTEKFFELQYYSLVYQLELSQMTVIYVVTHTHTNESIIPHHQYICCAAIENARWKGQGPKFQHHEFTDF